MTFTSRSPVWLSKYLWLELQILKTVCQTVFITLQSIVETEYGKTSHSKIFTFLRHFMIILKRNFFKGVNFTPYDRRWWHVGPRISDLTFLNDAFNSKLSLNMIGLKQIFHTSVVLICSNWFWFKQTYETRPWVKWAGHFSLPSLSLHSCCI